MKPIIAIVGRPNVGKSTLFNCLTKRRDALVLNEPGITRDRHYADVEFEEQQAILVDTGGLEHDDRFAEVVSEQAWQAVDEADLVLLVVDGRQGLNPIDESIAQRLRQTQTPTFVIINKCEGLEVNSAESDFYTLGFDQRFVISAEHRDGIRGLVSYLADYFKEFNNNTDDVIEEAPDKNIINIAVVGRPNVGKSTLINRILGEERVLVADYPGTTRDSIRIPFACQEQQYCLIDTAGVRRRPRVKQTIEKFSIVKTLQAIDDADVVLMLLDAHEAAVVEQDLRIIDMILQAGRAVVILINKWDGLESEAKARIETELERRLRFVTFARQHRISAKHGTGVGKIFNFINEAYQASHCVLKTAQVNQLLQEAVKNNSPPMTGRYRSKLRYAHIGGHNPPTIVIHGTRTEHVAASYQRYLSNFFQKKLRLVGTPLFIKFQDSDNPYSTDNS